MKKILSKLLPVVLLFGLMAFSQSAFAGTGMPDELVQNDYTGGSTAGDTTGLTATLLTATRYALYIFYLLGIVFMGVAAIKFKNGDMEAMGKNLGGAVMLFLVPTIIRTLLLWTGSSNANSYGSN